jgi:dienelactone hydrolase
MKEALIPVLLLAAGAISARGEIVTKAIDYSDGNVQLEGYLAYDSALAAKGKLPGVLVVSEWWGLNDYAKGRARQLAGLGYVAFALDMYGKGLVTTDKTKAGEWAGQFYGSPLMATRAQAGLDQLLGTGLVDPARVAAIGYCFGGSTVQALAYSGAPLAGVVSFHGGLIPVPPDAAAKNKAKFLVIEGAIDPSLKKPAVDAFLEAMNAGKFDFQYVIYAGAKHAFTNPDADRLARINGLESMIGYNADADRRSWEAMRGFFDEIFGASR